MPTPLREAARVIAVDDQQRVLLLRYDENGGFWATPGGSLDPGEDHTAAARRELREELGIDNAHLSPQLAERNQDHLVGGREVRQIERYYLAHIQPDAVDPTRATQPDQIREWRWWTLDELRTTDQTIYPGGLADLITNALTQGVPHLPIVLSS